MNTRRVAALSLIGSFAIVGLLVPYLEYAELKNYDLLMFLRGPSPTPSELVIVAVDQASIDPFLELGFSWPWPRSIHGQLIQQLVRAGARAVAFDMIFDLDSAPGEDAAMAEAIRESPIPVVLGATIESVQDPRFDLITEITPIPPLTDAGASIGFVQYNPDNDGVIRHARLTVGGEPGLSFALLESLNQPLSPKDLPIVGQEEDPRILINYHGPAGSIQTVSYYQAIDFEASLPEGTFRDKIVLVGRSITIPELGPSQQPDFFNTPLDFQMSGVEIHANVLANLLSRQHMRQAPWRLNVLVVFLLGATIGVVMLWFQGIRTKFLVSLSILFGFSLLAASLFIVLDYWIFLAQPLAVGTLVLGSNTFYQFRVQEKETAHIRSALGGYVSTQVLDEVLANPGALTLGGKELEATVLFCDIAGFSSISEAVTPQELSSLLNDYFSRVGDAIMGHQGMINKYIGDAIMAVWGAPLEIPEHARLACQTALDMKEIISNIPRFDARIGLNSGRMVAGNLGHHERMEYTVIGDAVNLASRLEGANKAFGTKILISESTEELVRGQFLLRQLDRIRVLGKEQPVNVYELVSELEPADPALSRLVGSFAEILAAYQAQNWEPACALIDAHLRNFPSDGAAQTYRKRCLSFLETPPPPDWDGCYSLTKK